MRRRRNSGGTPGGTWAELRRSPQAGRLAGLGRNSGGMPGRTWPAPPGAPGARLRARAPRLLRLPLPLPPGLALQARQACRPARSRAAPRAEALRRRRNSGGTPGRTWAGPALPGALKARLQAAVPRLQGLALRAHLARRAHQAAEFPTAHRAEASPRHRHSGASPGRT